MRWWQFLIWTAIVLVPGMAIQFHLYRKLEKIRRSAPVSAWSELQRELAKTLHKPHPESQELDALLEKLETFAATGVNMISDGDTNRLMELLREKVEDTKQLKNERARAEFLLLAIPRAKKERESKR